MKSTIKTLTGISAAMLLTFCAFGVYAAESHMEEALKHAEAASKAADSKSIAEHAEAAKSHAKVALEHLNAGAKSLDQTIEHGKQGLTDIARKDAEEAVKHLKAAQ